MTVALIAIYLLLAAVDVWTTATALKQPNMEEANPIPRWLFARFGALPTMIVIKALGLILLVAVIRMQAQGAGQLLAKWGFVAGVLIVAAYVSWSNVKLLRR